MNKDEIQDAEYSKIESYSNKTEESEQNYVDDDESVEHKSGSLSPVLFILLGCVLAVMVYLLFMFLIGNPAGQQTPKETPIVEVETPEPTPATPEPTVTPTVPPTPEVSAPPEPTVAPTPRATTDPAMYHGEMPVFSNNTSADGAPPQYSTISPSYTTQESEEQSSSSISSQVSAAKSYAESVLSSRALSRSELITTLTAAGYSYSDAQEASDLVGTSWQQNAISRASDMMYSGDYTWDQIYQELLSCGFSQAEAEAATNAVWR